MIYTSIRTKTQFIPIFIMKPSCPRICVCFTKQRKYDPVRITPIDLVQPFKFQISISNAIYVSLIKSFLTAATTVLQLVVAAGTKCAIEVIFPKSHFSACIRLLLYVFTEKRHCFPCLKISFVLVNENTFKILNARFKIPTRYCNCSY